MYNIECFTDGSACVKGVNKGRGGFGTYFPNLLGEKKAYSSGYKNTKTGRMEITALLYALKAIPRDTDISLMVYADSEYVIKSFTEKRLDKWIKNNWKTYTYKGELTDVKNIDLWKRVLLQIKLRPKLILNFTHVKGHQYDKEKDLEKRKEMLNNPHVVGNIIADRLANYKNFKENELKEDLY